MALTDPNPAADTLTEPNPGRDTLTEPNPGGDALTEPNPAADALTDPNPGGDALTDPNPGGDSDVVVDNVWDNAPTFDSAQAPFDPDCSPTRVCRNARDFTFAGIGEDGDDPAESWRELLKRENKASPGGESLRRLLLDPSAGG